MAREPISQKVRFEVFKRDSFTCQYCGAKAPDVVLQVDHIHPVAEGGDSEILNLATSCRSCNAGKGARLLSDDSVVEKQRSQIEELQERREQLEMMLRWRDGVRSLADDQVSSIVERLGDRTGWTPNENAQSDIRRWIKMFGFAETIEAIDDAFDHHIERRNGEVTQRSWNLAFKAVEGFCHNRKRVKNKHALPKLLYIQGILRRRLDDRHLSCLKHLDAMHGDARIPLDDLQALASESDSWDEFLHYVDGYLRTREPVFTNDRRD